MERNLSIPTMMGFARAETLVITTPLNGTFEALGTVAGGASSGVGALGGAVGNLIGGNVGQQVQHFAGGALNQKVDLQGTVVTSPGDRRQLAAQDRSTSPTCRCR